MGFETALEKTRWEDLNFLNEDRLRHITKNAIKSSFKKIDELERKGYGVSTFNKRFMNEVGKDVDDALSRVDNQNLNKLRSTASYVKNHLQSLESSVAGMQEIDKLNLRTIARLGGNEDPTIKRTVRKRNTNPTQGYTVDGTFFSRERLKEFWKIMDRLKESNKMETHGGSDYIINDIATKVFIDKEDGFIKEDGSIDYEKVLDRVEERYSEIQEEQRRREEEYEEKFEKIKSKAKYSST